ncbi:MAG TPA: protein kinase [Burkholderiales bacterium]|nr:protein kinase [Burkholderiales bacterium]
MVKTVHGLPLQSTLHEYRIEQVLGVGGFGITYLCHDNHLDKPVALKEYLPGELATRAEGKVVPLSAEREQDYRWGLERFLLEARTLAKFSHPNIVLVLRYFEANGTAYMVMDYERGEPLKNLLQQAPLPPEALLKKLAAPLLEGLAVVHAGRFLHRDIKPENIIVRPGGEPVLIDFGAARNAIGGTTRSLTAVLTPGYAPLEQYSGEGKQGPWTDLYAFAGVLYRAVTGRAPPDAVTRLKGDAVGAGLSAARGRYSEAFLRAIQWGLDLDEKQRPQTVPQWRKALLAPAPSAAKEEEKTLKIEPTAKRRRRWPWILLGLLVLLLLGLVARKKQADLGTDFEREVQAQFRNADANGDGFLSREEAERHFPFVAREFQRVDTDGDGRLWLEEFRRVRRLQLERRLRKGG